MAPPSNTMPAETRSAQSEAPALQATARRARLTEWQWLLLSLIGVDTLALVIGVGLANLIRTQLDELQLPGFWQLTTERHLVASVLVVPILLLLFRLQGLYRFDNILAGTREYGRIAHAATYGVVIAVAASYVVGGGPLLISRSWLLLVWLLSILSACIGRFATRRVVRRLRHQGKLRTRIVIVGASRLGVSIAEQFETARNEGLQVVGFLDEYIPLGQRLVGNISVIGRPEDLVRGIPLDLADEFVLVPQALPHQRVEELSRLIVSLNHPVVRMAVSSSELLTNGLLVAERCNVPLVTLERAQITGVDALLKRTLDIVGSLAGLALLGPVALFRLFRKGGSVRQQSFEKQWIRGAHGQAVNVRFLEPGISDSLVVRGVPALLNVLRGELSLVGPRPVALNGRVNSAPDQGLTDIKPGLTGPWRLSGPEASLEDQAIQDLVYVRNYSIWEDLRILWQTAYRVNDFGSGPLGRWGDRES